jgi:hypothetical protein
MMDVFPDGEFLAWIFTYFSAGMVGLLSRTYGGSRDQVVSGKTEVIFPRKSGHNEELVLG